MKRGKEMAIPPTVDRVAFNTDPAINEEIRSDTINCLKKHKHSNKSKLSEKIDELNDEWDTERVLEANAASIVMLGSLMGLRYGRHWYLITGTVGGFLLLHAIQGWCPPIPLIRKMGIRTPEEINNEKMVLKILRGDFNHLRNNVSRMLKAVEKS